MALVAPDQLNPISQASKVADAGLKMHYKLKSRPNFAYHFPDTANRNCHSGGASVLAPKKMAWKRPRVICRGQGPFCGDHGVRQARRSATGSLRAKAIGWKRHVLRPPQEKRTVSLNISRNGQTRTIRFFDRGIAVKQGRTLLDFGYEVSIDDNAGEKFTSAEFDRLLSLPWQGGNVAAAAAGTSHSIDQVVQVLSEILQDANRQVSDGFFLP